MKIRKPKTRKLKYTLVQLEELDKVVLDSTEPIEFEILHKNIISSYHISCIIYAGTIHLDQYKTKIKLNNLTNEQIKVFDLLKISDIIQYAKG